MKQQHGAALVLLVVLWLAGVLVLPAGASATELYASNHSTTTVTPFAIGADGSLTAIACGACTTGSDPEGVAVSPNGRFLYTVNNSGSVSVFSIAAAGSLTPIACASTNCSVGLGPDFQSVAITPDQAPVASFTATRPKSGQRYRFNGSSSSASAGQSVARYDWNFGDGSTAANAGPSPTHTYAAPGAYTVSLTVTDDAGCSTHEGVNRIRFAGSVSRIKKLEPGRYTLVITAKNATGKRSVRRSLRFTIVR